MSPKAVNLFIHLLKVQSDHQPGKEDPGQVAFSLKYQHDGAGSNVDGGFQVFCALHGIHETNLLLLVRRGPAPPPKVVPPHFATNPLVFATRGPVAKPHTPCRARKDALLQRFIEDGRFPHQPVAVYESRKSPMAFLFLSAMPIVAFLLLYYGITDALALLAAAGLTAAASGGGGDGGGVVEGIAEGAAVAASGSTSV